MPDITQRSNQPRRKRGAQPANINALKSGFYSRTFTDEEMLEIGRLAISELSLDEEIGMLRILILRVINSDLLPGEAIELFGRATGQLRRLFETRAKLLHQGLDDNSIDEAMSKALDELAEEMGIDL
jgi:hypothetical protein